MIVFQLIPLLFTERGIDRSGMESFELVEKIVSYWSARVDWISNLEQKILVVSSVVGIFLFR